MKDMVISLLLVATNKYKKFVQPLIDGVKQYFLNNHQINIHLFIDEIGEYIGDSRVAIKQHIIPSYRFPEATLLRYEIFRTVDRKEYDDYIIYLDVDMAIVDEVGDEILDDVIAVLHPGYYNGGWGDDGTTESSLAYTPKHLRKNYYAGGFQGGERDRYYFIIINRADVIRADLDNKIIAGWHDESHWNRYLALNPPKKQLTPSYCMPEPEWKRKAWGITQFKPIILALEKEEDIRE